ncbi:MAG: hypothetical protein ABIP94_01150 [Planctomycetota bacterium]
MRSLEHGARNDLRFVRSATGTVAICWGAMSGLGTGHLVGYSPAGASLDPGNSNLSDVRSASP